MKILSYEQYLSNPFLVRRKNVNKDGLTSISVRISISGDKSEFSSLQFVKPEMWSQTGRAKEAVTINDALDKIKIALDKHYKSILEKDGYVNSRQKSDVEANIPLLEIPLNIIRKYRKLGSDKLLPMHTNQKINEYLKEIANLCGIKKKLTTHCLRHTFGTIMLTKGVSIESVSKMLEHTNITTTQIYAKILNEKNNVQLIRLHFTLFYF